MNAHISSSAQKDIDKVAAMGVGESSLRSYDTYLQRYIDEIDEVTDITMEPDGNIVVAINPVFRRTIILINILQVLALFVVSELVLRVYRKISVREETAVRGV